MDGVMAAMLAYKTIFDTKNYKKAVHLLMQLLAFILSLIGVWAAIRFHNDKGIDNFYILHSWLGLAYIILFRIHIVDTLTMLYNMQQLYTSSGVTRFYFDSIFSLYLMRDPVAPNHIYDPERIKCHVGDAGWIFVPICKGDRWFACAIDTVCEEIYLLDSMSTGGDYGMKVIKNEVAAAIEDYCKYVGESKAVSSWEVKLAKGLPHQTNGVDCGVHMLCNMFSFIPEKTPKYRSGQIAYWRRQFASFILNSSLNDNLNSVQRKAIKNTRVPQK